MENFIFCALFCWRDGEMERGREGGREGDRETEEPLKQAILGNF